MKTRKIIAYILVLVMLVGVLAGCKKTEKKPTEPKTNQYSDGNNETEEETETKNATEANKPTQSKPTTPSNPTLPPQPTAPTNPPSEPDCDHNPKEWIMAATCVSEGAKMQRCEQCGYILSSEKIDKLPHETEWVVEKEATCKDFGEKYQQCKDCKEVFVHILTAKADHTPDVTGLKCKDCNAAIPPLTN